MQRPQLDRLLPGMFQRAAGPATMVAAVLDVMAELHEADEAILDDIDAVFDPYRTPDRFVPFLARWVDLDRLLPPDADEGEIPYPPGYGCLRNLVANGAELAQWRGTSAGLRWFLRLATGVDGFTVVEDVPGRPFHIEVHVPAGATAYLELVQRIVAMEKPAFVTATVVPTDAEPPPPDPQPTPPATVAPEATAPITRPTDLIDAPTRPVPVVEAEDRWTGAGTESAAIPVAPPAEPPPAPTDEGATP